MEIELGVGRRAGQRASWEAFPRVYEAACVFSFSRSFSSTLEVG